MGRRPVYPLVTPPDTRFTGAIAASQRKSCDSWCASCSGSARHSTGALPAGQAATSSDCNDSDETLFQKLAYSYRDADGDGFTVAVTPASICTGAALPAGYLDHDHGNDCNDCNDGDDTRWRWLVVYADHDGDGVGAPPRALACRGATLPAGFSMYGDDDDDADPAVQSDEDAAIALHAILF